MHFPKYHDNDCLWFICEIPHQTWCQGQRDHRADLSLTSTKRCLKPNSCRRPLLNYCCCIWENFYFLSAYTVQLAPNLWCWDLQFQVEYTNDNSSLTLHELQSENVLYSFHRIQSVLWFEKGRLWCSSLPLPFTEHLTFFHCKCPNFRSLALRITNRSKIWVLKNANLVYKHWSDVHKTHSSLHVWLHHFPAHCTASSSHLDSILEQGGHKSFHMFTHTHTQNNVMASKTIHKHNTEFCDKHARFNFWSFMRKRTALIFFLFFFFGMPHLQSTLNVAIHG